VGFDFKKATAHFWWTIAWEKPYLGQSPKQASAFFFFEDPAPAGI